MASSWIGFEPAGRNDNLEACPAIFMRQLEQRLALDDGVVVGERVEGLDQEATIAGFEVDVAQRPQCQATARIEVVQQALPRARLTANSW